MRHSGYSKRARCAVSAVLAMLVASCDPTEFIDSGPDLTVQVQADASGDGSGVVTVETPGLNVFSWECSVIDGQTAGDGLNEGACSRDYTTVGGTEVVFGAQGSGSRFVEWTGGHCSGTSASCSVTYAPPLSGDGTELIIARVKFEATPETVELTIDGESDAVTLLQGLTAGAVAAAKKADGEVISGAAYTWSSDAPDVVSVSGTSAGTGTVRGESPGTASISASSRGIESNPVTVTVVGPQSANGILQGVLYDVDGQTPLDSVYVSGGPVQGSQGDALRWRTGRQIPLSDIVIPSGGYRFEATNGRYAVFTVGVLDNRYVSTPGDTADVFSEQTTDMDMFIAHGYHLDMLDTDLGTIQAASGETIDLIVDYRAWNRDMCPGCVPALGIGVDATALAVYRFGTPGVYPGTSETGVAIPIIVPDHGGTIYATLITVSTGADIEPGLQQYRDRWEANVQGTTMIPIGTLTLN